MQKVNAKLPYIWIQKECCKRRRQTAGGVRWMLI
jgi:hypothetical protein